MVLFACRVSCRYPSANLVLPGTVCVQPQIGGGPSMAAVATAVAQRKIAEARREKLNQKKDSVSYIKNVLTRYDVSTSGLAPSTSGQRPAMRQPAMRRPGSPQLPEACLPRCCGGTPALTLCPAPGTLFPRPGRRPHLGRIEIVSPSVAPNARDGYHRRGGSR